MIEYLNEIISSIGLFIFIFYGVIFIACLCIIISFFYFMGLIKRDKMNYLRIKNIDTNITRIKHHLNIEQHKEQLNQNELNPEANILAKKFDVYSKSK